MEYEVFVSYKRKNKEQVLKLVSVLERRLEVRCWIDLTGIESSTQFASKICNAIDNCRVVLFMYSEEHLHIDYENDYTIKELNYARAKGKKVVLVKLDDAALDNVFLLEFGTKDFIESKDRYQMEKLISNLSNWLGRQTKTSEDPFEQGVRLFEQGQFRDAYRIFIKLAQEGHRRAQYYVGICYSQGKGVKQDLQAAAKWISEADKHNAETAVRNSSQNIDDDYHKAVDLFKNHWYREAYKIFLNLAQRGHVESQYYVALCYSQGKGVEVNLDAAAKWYAAADNNKDR